MPRRRKEKAKRGDKHRAALRYGAIKKSHALTSLMRGTRRPLVELVAADGTELLLECQERRASHSKPMRCDHCQKSFGLILYRHFRLRFCTADCLTAYQRRLDASRYSSAHSRLGAHAAAASSNRERV